MSCENSPACQQNIFSLKKYKTVKSQLHCLVLFARNAVATRENGMRRVGGGANHRETLCLIACTVRTNTTKHSKTALFLLISLHWNIAITAQSDAGPRFRKGQLIFQTHICMQWRVKKMCNDNSLLRQWKRETKKILSLNKIYTWKERLWIGQGEREVFCLSTGIGRLKDTIARRPLPKRAPPSYFHYCIGMLSSSHLGAKTQVKCFTL